MDLRCTISCHGRVGNQASSPSSKNTLRTICTSTKVEIFLLVPGHPGTTPSYAPGLRQ